MTVSKMATVEIYLMCVIVSTVCQYVYECFDGVHVCASRACLMPREVRKEFPISCNWSYGCLSATRWKLETEPVAYARVTNALNH